MDLDKLKFVLVDQADKNLPNMSVLITVGVIAFAVLVFVTTLSLRLGVKSLKGSNTEWKKILSTYLAFFGINGLFIIISNNSQSLFVFFTILIALLFPFFISERHHLSYIRGLGAYVLMYLILFAVVLLISVIILGGWQYIFLLYF